MSYSCQKVSLEKTGPHTQSQQNTLLMLISITQSFVSCWITDLTGTREMHICQQAFVSCHKSPLCLNRRRVHQVSEGKMQRHFTDTSAPNLFLLIPPGCFHYLKKSQCSCTPYNLLYIFGTHRYSFTQLFFAFVTSQSLFVDLACSH